MPKLYDCVVASNPEQRPDLGASFARVARRLASAEKPLLAARELTMWDYIVLSQLGSAPASSQLTLAAQVGYDKSRLIALLDGLEARGAVQRVRDPADRRSHGVSLTARGRNLLASARADIRKMEEAMLSSLDTDEQQALLSALAKLSPAPDEPDPAS